MELQEIDSRSKEVGLRFSRQRAFRWIVIPMLFFLEKNKHIHFDVTLTIALVQCALHHRRLL